MDNRQSLQYIRIFYPALINRILTFSFFLTIDMIYIYYIFFEKKLPIKSLLCFKKLLWLTRCRLLKTSLTRKCSVLPSGEVLGEVLREVLTPYYNTSQVSVD